MKRPDIHLHIDKLVLHGFDHVNREVLHEALTGELSRLLSSAAFTPETLPVAGIPKLDGGSISTSRQPDSSTIGTQIAHVVFQGLTE